VARTLRIIFLLLLAFGMIWGYRWYTGTKQQERAEQHLIVIDELLKKDPRFEGLTAHAYDGVITVFYTEYWMMNFMLEQDGADPLKLLEEVIEETNPPVLVKYAKESDSATGNADLDFPLDDIEVLEKDSIDLEDDGPINADDSL
jgi:hypothetical protein